MNNLKLEMDLLPKGAWGNDLSVTLPKKDWDVFNEHLTKALALYERRNTVYHWRIIADLASFGGNNIELKNIYYPFIINPYSDDEIQALCSYTGQAPSLIDLQIDNYAGIIKVKCARTNKIQWFVDDELSVNEFGFTKKFVSSFSVKNLTQSCVSFKLIGNSGEYISKKFLLKAYN